MRFDDALRRYGVNEFTDDDIIRCTGLSDRKWRDLIKDKLVRTVVHRPGRGRIRLCDATTLKRAAVIAALNRAGLNLPVSAQIAYFAPFHSALYEIIDPYAMLVDRSVAVDPQRDSLPLRRPRLDWFDQSRPARAESDRDWVLKIYDGRYVGINYGPKPTTAIFGDLRNAATRFVAWVPLHQVNEFVGCAIEKLAREFRQNPAHAYVAWEDPAQWSRELNLLGYAYEHHGENDPLRIRAAATVPCSLFTTNINVSLAIRKALRRYLGIEPAEGES